MNRMVSMPIAGVGAEVWGWTMGWSWCGECGYTGRVKGSRQASCPCLTWHAWLERCAEDELPTRGA